MGPASIIDAFFASLCLYLFVSRLKKTNKLNDKDLQYVTNKLTILQSVTIIFTLSASLLFYLIPLLAVVGMDTTINAICLVLSVKGNDKYYRRMCILCRCCCERISDDERGMGDILEMGNMDHTTTKSSDTSII